MSFSSAKRYFIKDGKPFFLISGEIHYFRLNPKLWEKHLRLLKQSGANTTSTYVPWDWHEYEEGKFDFTGETHPARNLIKYIKLCKKNGLQLIVKPGPYILAEYEAEGLPGWLLKRISKNSFALDELGEIISPNLVSYMTDEFLEYTFLWYDKIMPIIAKYQESKGGPITMMQVCNEVGVFQWLFGKVDYNPSVIKLYKEFLKEKYNSVEKLNSVYGTEFSSFEKISAPIGKIENKQDYCAYFDFHLFYRHYFAMYLDLLIKKIRSYGINVQLTHNIPGWIYGNAAELPMLISTYEEIMRTRKDLIFGIDHIPEFVSFRNAHSDLACNKILEAMQPYGPVWAAEFQSGTREHQVKCDANDLETFYFASLAHGLNGFNYYMFSQGINPDGKGYYGKAFYYQTPLSENGVKSPLYGSTKKVNDFITREKEDLLLSEVKSEICVGFYKPYFYTELTTSQLLKEKRLYIEKLGLTLDPRFVREEIFFNGLLRSLQTLNFNYDISDLENSNVENLLRYKQLWVVTTEFMDANTQKLLADYVKKGGRLILYPAVPTLDLYLNPCAVLQDELEIKFKKSVSPNKIDAFGIDDVYTMFKEKQIFQNVSKTEIVSTTKTGEVCGIRKNVGNGMATILGYTFGYTTDEHLHLIEKIVSLDSIKRQARVSDPDIQFVIRKGKKYSYMFLLNYHNQKKSFTVNEKKYTMNPFSCKVLKKKL
ncbi:MAG TPA: beta-galactosidase [Ignavibacteriaceae bacterium]|nr:beta-galactosidase [Ignavibacteriaceae bacterium]